MFRCWLHHKSPRNRMWRAIDESFFLSFVCLVLHVHAYMCRIHHMCGMYIYFAVMPVHSVFHYAYNLRLSKFKTSWLGAV